MCVKTTSGMHKSVYFCVRMVNPCNLVCGTHCDSVVVPVYRCLHLMQTASIQLCRDSKLSHTDFCASILIGKVSLSFYTNVCVCVP